MHVKERDRWWVVLLSQHTSPDHKDTVTHFCSCKEHATSWGRLFLRAVLLFSYICRAVAEGCTSSVFCVLSGHVRRGMCGRRTKNLCCFNWWVFLLNPTTSIPLNPLSVLFVPLPVLMIFFTYFLLPLISPLPSSPPYSSFPPNASLTASSLFPSRSLSSVLFILPAFPPTAVIRTLVLMLQLLPEPAHCVSGWTDVSESSCQQQSVPWRPTHLEDILILLFAKQRENSRCESLKKKKKKKTSAERGKKK